MILLNNKPINVTLFPDKTSQVWKLPEDDLKLWEAHVTWTFEYESEFMQLAQLKALLDEHGIQTTLYLTYLPYGRQDKHISNNETFALRPFAKLLNSLDFYWVQIMDPHSRGALVLIKNSNAIYPIHKVTDAFTATRSDLVCYPDKGAVEKYAEMYRPYTGSWVYGEKVRDQLTGKIISYSFEGDVQDKNVLIVDDIADGGATFILLAKALKDAGAREVNLFVTHGIFSKGVDVLFEAGINRIFTNEGEQKMSVYQFAKLVDKLEETEK